MVTFTPLSGENGVYQSILSIDETGASFLVDAGWNPVLDSSLDPILERVGSIDAILLTHATISHLGAYCYLCSISPDFAQIPTYATIPVVNMGRMVTIDSYRSQGIAGPFLKSKMTAEEIEEIFDRVHTIKYSQPLSLSGKLEGTSVTAFNAGHTLGGTIWKIVDALDTILVAVDWNHSRDGHLNGAFLEQNGKFNEQLTKPSLMIQSSQVSNGKSLKANRQQLLDDITTIIGKGGSVLLPTSTGSRMLELCLILDRHFAQNKVSVPLLLVSHVGQRVLAYASSMLEYMLSTIIDDWQVRNDSPFETQRVVCVTDLEQLDRITGPKVIMATGEALETGFSKPIFADIAKQPESAVILTEMAPAETLGNIVYDLWKEQGDSLNQLTRTLPRVSIAREVPLDGKELAAYNAELEEVQKQKELQEALDRRNREILEAVANDDESSDEEQDVKQMTGQAELSKFVGENAIYDLNVTEEAGRVYSFPFVSKPVRRDDYGEVLKPGQFETITDALGNEMSANGIDTVMRDADAPARQTHNWQEENVEGSSSSIVTETPHKLVRKETDIQLLCSVNYIDFNGLTDLRSLRMILPQVRAKKLIVLPGNNQAIKAISTLDLDSVVGDEPVHIKQTNFAINVKLTPDIEKALVWQQILGRFTVAHVTGRIAVGDEEDAAAESHAAAGGYASEDAADAGGDGSEPQQLVRNEAFLEVVSDRVVQEKAPIYVGDVKLTELKQKLAESGYSAEFKGQGVLVCNNKVGVRKLGEGRFVIEGGLDPEFYAVRQTIKAFLASV